MNEVFPRRNLPGMAEDWGRAVEKEIEGLERNTVQYAQTLDNGGRSNAGKLAVISRNLDELEARASITELLPDVSVSGSATSEPYPRTDIAVSFPAVSGDRWATLELSGFASESSPGGAVLYVYLIYEGNVIGQISTAFMGGSMPLEEQDGNPVQVFGGIVTKSDVPTVVTVRLVRASQFPGSSSVTLSNLSVTLTRSGVVS